MDVLTVFKDSLEEEYESYKDHILLLLSKQKLECASEYYELVKNAQCVEDLVSLFRTGILPVLLLYTDSEPSFDISGVNFKVDLKSLNNTLSKRETEEAMDPDETKNVFNATNNLNIFLKAAKNLNIVVVNVSSEDLLQGKNGDLVFGLTWQMIRRAIFRDVSIDRHPELLRLLGKNEKVSSFMSISDEEMILRWANKHLQDAGCPLITQVKTMGQFLKGKLLMKILNQVLPDSKKAEKERIKKSFNSPDSVQEFLDICRSLDIDIAFTAKDLLTGDLKVYSLVLASIFNKYTGLYLLSEEETKAIISENDILKQKVSSLESENKSQREEISEIKSLLSTAIADKQTLEIAHKELKDKLEEEKESLEAEVKNKESKEKFFLEQVLNAAKDINDESEVAFAKVSDEELHAKIKGVLSMSKLNTNFSKQAMSSPNSPTGSQSCESLKESCLESKPEPLNKDEVNSKPSGEACILYLQNAEKLLSSTNKVLEFKDANIAELVSRLEKLANINIVMTQKIREYTKEFMQQRKR